jgi:hypothetical protein
MVCKGWQLGKTAHFKYTHMRKIITYLRATAPFWIAALLFVVFWVGLFLFFACR